MLPGEQQLFELLNKTRGERRPTGIPWIDQMTSATIGKGRNLLLEEVTRRAADPTRTKARPAPGSLADMVLKASAGQSKTKDIK
jgi:hypothetical protein